MTFQGADTRRNGHGRCGLLPDQTFSQKYTKSLSMVDFPTCGDRITQIHLVFIAHHLTELAHDAVRRRQICGSSQAA